LPLFYQPEILQGTATLPTEESRHAISVLRLKSGDQITITDGRGHFYDARITEPDSRHCGFAILKKTTLTNKAFRIHIAIAPTKNADRMEWFVEKAVELGIDEVSFMVCKNSERTSINLARIEKLAVSAMKQSEKAWLPKLSHIAPFRNILATEASQKFIAFVDSGNPVHLKTVAQPAGHYLVLIGPEGDFSPEELQLAEANSFKKVTLGPSRLRTETAALTACQILNLINQ
jgi:16S rRNA (uracil1498-N3)-methyltransferase